MNILGSTDTSKAAVVFCVCFFIGMINQSFAQVSIAPTSLFFDNQNRIQSLTISNGGQQAQEISISTEFGYPTTKNGRLTITNDSVLAETKSIAEWINVFPQSFTLQGNQRQTVRFVSRPPNGLEPGGYWSRVKIQSNPVSPPIETTGENQVGAQINLVINQVISAHYHTPDANTGVEVTKVNFIQDESSETGNISVSMEQTGNAPFMGTIGLKVTDTDGETVFQTNTTNSVYTTITRSFSMDLSDIDPGKYTISGTINSERRDISQDKLLQIRPVTFQKQITIE